MIVVSCMGLFGLVTCTTESRVKELGVRKVLEAGTWQLAGLISRGFVTLILLAAIISFPLAWYLLSEFLRVYAYRTSLTGWAFLLAAGVTLLVSILTIGGKCLSTALANPVNALKQE